ncbi:MAG: hypothetical protein JKY11_08895 [Alphaproteobacteria bacterium]|nr:hypothetical protein [Alphaproteobacteria bacterium]
MRREEAIEMYGAYYTVNTNNWTIQEHLGRDSFFSNVPTSKEEAKLCCDFLYWQKELEDAANLTPHLRMSSSDMSALGYSQQDSSQKLGNICIEIVNFLSGPDHVYDVQDIKRNINTMRTYALEYRSLFAECNGDFEPQTLERVEPAYEDLPSDLNITSVPLKSGATAYGVFVEADGNVSVGKLSLVFNGVRSYSTFAFGGGKVSLSDEEVKLPIYKAIMNRNTVGLVQYVEPGQHSDLARTVGRLNLLDGPLDGVNTYSKHDGYDHIQICFEKQGAHNYLIKLAAHEDKKYNVEPASCELNNL